MNFKEIHIGKLIQICVKEKKMEIWRICYFMKCSISKVEEMYQQETISTDILLKWSKLLEYDFFRLYSQHLILYAPQEKMNYNRGTKSKRSSLPIFRKNLYTTGIIDFILEQINTKKMTKIEVIEKYKIPKTTLYKWISKYNQSQNPM